VARVPLVPAQPPLAVQEVAFVLDQVSVELPPESIIVGLADSVTVGSAAACVTVNVCPAIDSVPVKMLLVVFAATIYPTMPLPVPLDPDVIVIRLALLSALHSHSGCVVS
jgi:hypothetical protein